MRIKPVAAIGMLALLSACGTLHASTASTAVPGSTPVHKPLPPICPQAAAAVPAQSCVSVGVEQNQQSNEMYNVRKPMPAWEAAEAQPETQRIRQALERLTGAQRQNPAAVTAALRGAGVLSSGLVAYGPYRHQVTFGGYEPINTGPSAVCAYGIVTPTKIVLNIGGNTWEGACYTSGGQ